MGGIKYFLILLLFASYSAWCQPGIEGQKKGALLYENSFSSGQEIAAWELEGPAVTEFKEGWMNMYSPEEEGHHVLWCPADFPASFWAEWELQNIEPDAGLCIIFFAATADSGGSIFDKNLKPRNGVFSQYIKSDLNNYHISYYANTPKVVDREFAHLRKNQGFHKVHIGGAPLAADSREIHKAKLLKKGAHITMYIDDRKIIDWVDDGEEFGPALQGGKIGFRQMQWTHFRYRNFKVWEIVDEDVEDTGSTWPLHIIDNYSSGADGVKLGDVNHDNLMDIVTGWEEGGQTKIYFHPGKEQVKSKWPSIIIGNTPAVEDAVFGDLDGDGFLDVVSCTEGKSEKIFIHWSPKGNVGNVPDWDQKVLPASDGLMQWMYAEPLNVDGKNGLDIVAAGKNKDAALGWFQASENSRALVEWSWHEISKVGWVMSILVEDMDGDGDPDIIITDRRGPLSGCRWLENPGPGEALVSNWNSHMIGGVGLEVMFMSLSDMDGDGIKEALVSERTDETIRIFKRKDKDGKKWEERVIQIPSSTGRAKSVEVGDMNNDGVRDLVISTNNVGEIKPGLVWIDGNRLDNALPADFIPISGPHKSKFDKVELIDIDGDEDLDVLICEENFGEQSNGLGVIWFENLTVDARK